MHIWPTEIEAIKYAYYDLQTDIIYIYFRIIYLLEALTVNVIFLPAPLFNEQDFHS